MEFKEFDKIACTHCGAAAKKYCIKCSAPYCSKYCQRLDWTVHAHEHKDMSKLQARRRQLYSQRIEKLPGSVVVEPTPAPQQPQLVKPPTGPVPRPGVRPRSGNPVWDKMKITPEMLEALKHNDRKTKSTQAAMYQSLQNQAQLLESRVREYMSAEQHVKLDAATLELDRVTQKYARMLLKPNPTTAKATTVASELIQRMEEIANIVSGGENLPDPGDGIFDYVTSQFERDAQRADIEDEEAERPTGLHRTPDPVTPVPESSTHKHDDEYLSSFGPRYVTPDGVFLQTSEKHGLLEVKKLSRETVQTAQNRDFNEQLVSGGDWSKRFAAITSVDALKTVYSQFEAEFKEFEDRKPDSHAYGIRNSSFRHQQSTKTPEFDSADAINWLRTMFKDMDRRRKEKNVGMRSSSRTGKKKAKKAKKAAPEGAQKEEEKELPPFLEEDDWGELGASVWQFLKDATGATYRMAFMMVVILMLSTATIVVTDPVGTGPSHNFLIENEFTLPNSMERHISIALDRYAEQSELTTWVTLEKLLGEQGDFFHAEEIAKLNPKSIQESQFQLALGLPHTTDMVTEYGVLWSRTALNYAIYTKALASSIHLKTGFEGEDLGAEVQIMMGKMFGDQVKIIKDPNTTVDTKTAAIESLGDQLEIVSNAGLLDAFAKAMEKYLPPEEIILPRDPQAFTDRIVDAIFDVDQFSNETLRGVLLNENMDNFYEMIALPWTELPKILAPKQIEYNLRPQTTALYLESVKLFPDSQLMGDLFFSMLDVVTGISRTESLQLEVRRYLGRHPDAHSNFQEHDMNHITFVKAYLTWALWFWAWTYLIDWVIPTKNWDMAQLEANAALKAIQKWRKTLGTLSKYTRGNFWQSVHWIDYTRKWYAYRAFETKWLHTHQNAQRFSMQALAVMTMADISWWTLATSRHALMTSIPQWLNTLFTLDKTIVAAASETQEYGAIVDAIVQSEDVSTAVATGLFAIEVIGLAGTAVWVTWTHGPRIVGRLATTAKTVFATAESRNWRRGLGGSKIASLLVTYLLTMQGTGYVDLPLTQIRPIDVGPTRFDFGFNTTVLRLTERNEQFFINMAELVGEHWTDMPPNLEIGEILTERQFGQRDWKALVMQAVLETGSDDVQTITRHRENYKKIQDEALERRRKSRKKKEIPEEEEEEEEEEAPPPRKQLPGGETPPKTPALPGPKKTPPKRVPALPMTEP